MEINLILKPLALMATKQTRTSKQISFQTNKKGADGKVDDPESC